MKRFVAVLAIMAVGLVASDAFAQCRSGARGGCNAPNVVPVAPPAAAASAVGLNQTPCANGQCNLLSMDQNDQFLGAIASVYPAVEFGEVSDLPVDADAEIQSPYQTVCFQQPAAAASASAGSAAPPTPLSTPFYAAQPPAPAGTAAAAASGGSKTYSAPLPVAPSQGGSAAAAASGGGGGGGGGGVLATIAQNMRERAILRQAQRRGHARAFASAGR